MKKILSRTSGFTLIECLIVLMIIVILVSILTPKVADAIYYIELKRCTINSKTIEKSYVFHLIEHEIDNSENVFKQFLNDYNHDFCSMCMDLAYVDNQVLCIKFDHNEDDDIIEYIPYL